MVVIPVILLSLLIVVAVVGLIVSSRVPYSVLKTVEDDLTLPRLVLNDGTILHGETHGDPTKPTLMVVHGGPGWDYRALLPLAGLSDEYLVVFYDQRGTGLSPRVDDDELRFDQYLADLDALVDQFSPGRQVNLLGHSFGGMLVSGYVSQYPDKVAGVVLAGSGPLTTQMANHPNFKFPVGSRFILFAAGTWIESQFYSGIGTHRKQDYFLGKILGAYEGNGHPWAGYVCGREITEELSPHWRAGSRAMSRLSKTYPKDRAGLQFSVVEEVDRFETEVLFLAGSCDAILGPVIQAEQEGYFPNARLAVIENAGHEMFLDNPAASLAAVRAYLAERDR